MKEEHYVCEYCGECFEDNFTEYSLHIEECGFGKTKALVEQGG